MPVCIGTVITLKDNLRFENLVSEKRCETRYAASPLSQLFENLEQFMVKYSLLGLMIVLLTTRNFMVYESEVKKKVNISL